MPLTLSHREPKTNAETLMASPNPLFNEIWVRIQKSGDEIGFGRIEIRDMNGKLIRDQQLPGLKTRLNLSSLASGIYTLSYRNGTGNIETKNIIKQ